MSGLTTSAPACVLPHCGRSLAIGRASGVGAWGVNVPDSGGGNRRWDSDQELVITALRTDRLVVDAGPGTGKTEVACARVAYLIDREDCVPSLIWLISFTRTAVAELRERIASALRNPYAAYAVKIATLDSHAWKLYSGFSPAAALDADYDTNIARFTELLREDTELQEHIESIEHLIIDEAQDIVGIRADLVEELLKHLSKSCGVTIFADQAQAIYGFSSDDADEDSGGEAFLDRLADASSCRPFEFLALTKVFRTDSPRLLQIFSSLRNQVLEDGPDSDTKLQGVIQDIQRLADGEPDESQIEELRERDDLLILYRRRGDALLTSSRLREQGIPHRLRMSGLPICVRPWVAQCLSLHVDRRLDRRQFAGLWQANVPSTEVEREETAWSLLVRCGGETRDVVDMERLTSVLGRSRAPPEFCLPDVCTSGPIVGTIHASKGREAPTVHLMIPRYGARSKSDEEARVVFVGATRARTELLVGRANALPYKRVPASGRAFRSLPSEAGSYPRAQVEIGHDGDIDAAGIAGTSLFPEAADVQQAQAWLRRADSLCPVVARSYPEVDFAYALFPTTGQLRPLAYFAKEVNGDLFAIGKTISSANVRPPHRIDHLAIVGTRSLILSPDSPIRDRLHYPWSRSGIILAPVVLGFTAASFPYRRRRQY